MVKTEFKLKGLCRDIRMDCLHIGAISLAYVLPNPEWYVPPHSHTGFEIHIIPKGRGVINIEGTEFAVGPGEFYITGPFVKHEQTTDKSSPMGEYCLECDISIIDEASTPAALQQAQLIRRVLSGVYPKAFKDDKVIALVRELLNEDKQRQTGCSFRTQALIIDLILRIVRVISDFNAPAAPVYPPNSFEFQAERIMSYIKANYKEDINLSHASGALFISGRQINRIMEKRFGQSFHSCLMNHRIMVAKALLATTTLPIEQVAAEAGFSSHFYMYQVFKRQGLPTPAFIRSCSHVD